ncbi:zinc transporter ZntB [uncultured Boseongicola sp.]|jgi:zinc transporter|uniref:zinc transporter ZntB n=1 Tax=uncultured Boseongicola sp. TaxID=1648499 RepID=UPI002613185F|nr:zinc transporter ZntB [uncultured Boseongicola sp.]
MAEKSVHPICAFDIGQDGTVVPIREPWPSATTGDGMSYRWLHFDLADKGLDAWTREFLPETASTALRQSETRPRSDFLDGGLILNLRGVNLNPASDVDDMVSLRLWVTKCLIVSARMRKVWAVDAIREEMDIGIAPKSVGMFLAALTYGLTKRIEEVTIELEDESDAIEEEAFAGGQDMGGRVAQCRKSVIKLRRFIRPQKEALIELAANRDWLGNDAASVLLRETANKTKRSLESLEATHERLSATQDHLDILHATALGRNSYVLSIVAAIFLPLGFVTGLFGINVGGMPGVESDLGFWTVTVGSVVVGAALYAVFRYSKWL